MCVISFYPLADGHFILTSNRDEAPDRPTLPPAIYRTERARLLYPKDEVAGGTWIGASDHKRAAAIMNGGLVPHDRHPPYRMSRGHIVSQLLQANDTTAFFEAFDLAGIEPFTVFIMDVADQPALHRGVWDGNRLNLEALPWKPDIWSSAPIYPPEMQAAKGSAFRQLIESKSEITDQDLWAFHHGTGTPSSSVPMLIQTEYIHTKSITQLLFEDDGFRGRYHDLETGDLWEKSLLF